VLCFSFFRALHLFFTSKSVVYVDGGRKSISCTRAQNTLATPLSAQDGFKVLMKMASKTDKWKEKRPLTSLSGAPSSAPLSSIFDGPDLWELLDCWVSVEFLHAPIPRKGSGSTTTFGKNRELFVIVILCADEIAQKM